MDKNSKKSLFIKIRVTQKEKESIDEKAKNSGLSTSDYIRQTTLNYRLRNNRLQKDILCTLTRIASNINQIARHANMYKSYSNTL